MTEHHQEQISILPQSVCHYLLIAESAGSCYPLLLETTDAVSIFSLSFTLPPPLSVSNVLFLPSFSYRLHRGIILSAEVYKAQISPLFPLCSSFTFSNLLSSITHFHLPPFFQRRTKIKLFSPIGSGCAFSFLFCL